MRTIGEPVLEVAPSVGDEGPKRGEDFVLGLIVEGESRRTLSVVVAHSTSPNVGVRQAFDPGLKNAKRFPLANGDERCCCGTPSSFNDGDPAIVSGTRDRVRARGLPPFFWLLVTESRFDVRLGGAGDSP